MSGDTQDCEAKKYANVERARDLIQILKGIPELDYQAMKVSEALDRAEARGEKRGIERAAELAWKIGSEKPPEQIGCCLIGDCF